MNTRVHLDLDGMNALFPEGSEARVELSRSVAVSLVARLAVKEVKFLDETLKGSVREIVNKEVVQLGGPWASVEQSDSSSIYNHVRLTQQFTLAIRQKVNSLITKEISDAVRSALAENVALINTEIENAITRRLDKKVKDGLKDMIREVVRESITIN